MWRSRRTRPSGAKFVSLSSPEQPSSARLAAGATIDASRVTVELNTVFEKLTTVLRTVDPGKLDSTLGALSTALQGRGERLGVALEQADSSLLEFNTAREALDHVLTDLPAVTQTYRDAVLDLMDTLDSLTTTGTTVLDEQQNLDLLLLNVIGVARTGEDVLGANAAGIDTVLSLLRPTTALLEEYSPVIPCMFHGLQESKKIGDGAYNGQPGIKNVDRSDRRNRTVPISRRPSEGRGNRWPAVNGSSTARPERQCALPGDRHRGESRLRPSVSRMVGNR